MENNEIAHRVLAQLHKSNLCCNVSHDTVISHIIHPRNFYVQLTSLSTELKLLERKGNPITDHEIQISRSIIYKSVVHDKYVRGKIESILYRETDVLCTIFAMDYGCTEKNISLKNVHLPYLDIKCPGLALQCQLQLFEPKGAKFTDYALRVFRFIVSNPISTTKFLYKTMGRYVVQIKTQNCPFDIAQTLRMLNITPYSSSYQQYYNARVSNPYSSIASLYMSRSTIPDPVMLEPVMPSSAMSRSATPGFASSGFASPGFATPGFATPGFATPGLGTSSFAMPGFAMPDIAMRGSAMPGPANPYRYY